MDYPDVRPPAVAGTFYPASPPELEETVFRLLDDAGKLHKPSSAVRGIVVPHAGYRYSGKAAAQAYATLRGTEKTTVHIMGNAHTAMFEGIAADCHDAWRSPLGSVQIDIVKREKIRSMAPDLISCSNRPHQCDHILEIHLPFLQRTLKPGFTILPFLFGQNPPGAYQTFSSLLMRLMRPSDLLIASSDLSHYPSYPDACTIDRITLALVANLSIEGLEKHEIKTMKEMVPGEEALFCGPDAIKTAMEIARRSGWIGKKCRYLNSGDIDATQRGAVVGYGSVVFLEKQPSHNPAVKMTPKPDSRIKLTKTL